LADVETCDRHRRPALTPENSCSRVKRTTGDTPCAYAPALALRGLAEGTTLRGYAVENFVTEAWFSISIASWSKVASLIVAWASSAR
jgi:hypothetical protein